MKRTVLKWIWRFTNPLASPLAGVAPWWVRLEMTGVKTGRMRRIPLAAGPSDQDGLWVVALHGRRAAWVRNVEANPHVRLKYRFRWHAATATIVWIPSSSTSPTDKNRAGTSPALRWGVAIADA